MTSLPRRTPPFSPCHSLAHLSPCRSPSPPGRACPHRTNRCMCHANKHPALPPLNDTASFSSLFSCFQSIYHLSVATVVSFSILGRAGKWFPSVSGLGEWSYLRYRSLMQLFFGRVLLFRIFCFLYTLLRAYDAFVVIYWRDSL